MMKYRVKEENGWFYSQAKRFLGYVYFYDIIGWIKRYKTLEEAQAVIERDKARYVKFHY